MTALGADDFPAFFKAVHRFDPFPWQMRLVKQVVGSGTWPKLLDLPTGAGKTAAIDIAIFHLACEANRGSERRAPLRILFVIDRRIVVDSAAERAKKIRDALQSPEQRALHPILTEVAQRLSSLSGHEEHPLDVVRLRGGVPLERDWARSPAQPLVAVSTVDQVGSRLLFRGYGVSPRMWPVHAGLVGADVLWLLDEVHLSRPLEQTLKAIEQGHPSGDRNGVLADRPRLAPFASVRLSATPGEKEADGFSLSEEDRVHSELRPRLDASKLATLHEIDKEPEEALADCALDLLSPSEKSSSRKGRKKLIGGVAGETTRRQPLRVAVVVNRVDLARRVFERLRKLVKGEAEDDAEVVLLTGRVRPLDRDWIINRLKSLNLFAEPKRGDPRKPVILVATQTIEAGADLDVDALVTEIAPLDCLRQRFGRLDRLGERRESKATILLHKKSSKEWKTIEKIYGQTARATADWLDAIKDKKGEIDFGIGAFEIILQKFSATASEPKLEDLIARRPDAPVLLPVYADLWATTSPAPAATPEPALFLHGPSTATDLQIVWRADINLDDVPAANISLDFCPPTSLEALSLPVWAAQRWLDARDSAPLADVVERTPEWDHEGGQPNCLRYDGNLAEGERWTKVESNALRPGDRVVVPVRIGGCDAFGWNPESKDEVVDLGTEANYLQRLKGTLRITRETLANALHREGRKAETETIWDEIRRALPEEGEDGAATEARALVGVLLDWKVTLPLFWRTLIEGRGRQKGIKDRRVNIATFGSNDWSRGCVLYAEKGLDTGLFDDATEDEPDGSEATTERDNSSRIGEKILLVHHLQHVEKQARTYAQGAGLDDHLVGLVALAARLHDIGKAELRFQADLHGQSTLLRLGLIDLEPNELIAKSARGEGRRGGDRAVPDNFRHEALSVALAASHPAILKLDQDDCDLVLWLIGTHHGYGRPFFPPMIDDAAESEVTVPDGIVGSALHAQAGAVPLRLDQGWFERAGRLLRRFGPWELARLEAILRLADHAASAEERDVPADVPTAKMKEALT